MQHNNEYKNTYLDINECTSRGVCSTSPAIAALQEVAMLFLYHLAHYTLKLEKLGGRNINVKYEILTVLASLVSVNEFSENQLYEIILKEYYLLDETKKTYKQFCKNENITHKDLKNVANFNANTSLSQTITLGEKLFLENYKKLSTEQKNLIELLQIIIKSVSLNIIKLSDFDNFNNKIYHEVLETLDMFNHNKKLTNKYISEKIYQLTNSDNKLQLDISKYLIKTFGGIQKVEVSHSTRKGKAILVSGNNFFDLLNILKETSGKDIDIYTHSNLLITHALKDFHNFEHLRGHYGDLTENCILDFATFPGAILLTKNSKSNSEYFYRGRLFSNDYIVPNGVIKIDNNNYAPLIESAINAKGFSKGKIKESTELGYNEEEITEKFNEIIEKLNNNHIEHLYIIGIDSQQQLQHEYFKELFENLNKNEYVISFSYKSKKENVLTIPIGNYIPLAANLLKQFFDKYPITDSKIVFFATTCDVMTISNIINLKNMNASKIYMAKCPPTLVNPSVYETFRKKYNIKETTEAISDLEYIRNKKSTP